MSIFNALLLILVLAMGWGLLMNTLFIPPFSTILSIGGGFYIGSSIARYVR